VKQEELSALPGWVSCREERLDLGERSPAELLDLTYRLPGTERFGSARAGEVFLVKEMPSAGVPSGVGGAEPEVVEATLDTWGRPWRRRETGWVIPGGADLPREVEILPEAEGLRLSLVLADWDSLGETEERALARLLCRAQLGLRFGRQALLAARVPGPLLEILLPHALAGLRAGAQLLGREAGALLVPEVAQVYLTFQEGARLPSGPLA
jgi:hypothetical protein